MIEEVKKRTLEDIRVSYMEYLDGQNLSKNTIMTSSNVAFFIWRKKGVDSFWNVIFSDNFEVLGIETLLDLLRQQSRGNAEANANS